MSLPRVSIVILAHLESNRVYFEACLASVRNLDYPKELLDVVVVSPYAEAAPDYLLIHAHGRAQSFSGSFNEGVSWTNPTSEHLLVLSDDTIITRGALKAMVETIGDVEAVISAISNCDNYLRYVLRLPHVFPARFYRLESGDVDAGVLMNAESAYPGGVLMTSELCFYAVLIPRAVWAKVGELDEVYNMGYEDTDYCRRAANAGVHCVIVLNAIIWHAGGVSAELITDEMRESNERRFKGKWEQPLELGPYE